MKVYNLLIFAIVVVSLATTSSVVHAGGGYAQARIWFDYPIQRIEISGYNQNEEWREYKQDFNLSVTAAPNFVDITGWWWKFRTFDPFSGSLGNGPHIYVRFNNNLCAVNYQEWPDVGLLQDWVVIEFRLEDAFDCSSPQAPTPQPPVNPTGEPPIQPQPSATPSCPDFSGQNSNINFSLVEPGDVILTRWIGVTDVFATAQTVGYGGYWAHAAIVLESFDECGLREIAHSNSATGVIIEPITALKFFWDVVILRVDVPPYERRDAAHYAALQAELGRQYNDNFVTVDKNNPYRTSFSCSELVWAAYYYTSDYQTDLDSNESVSAQAVLGTFGWSLLGQIVTTVSFADSRVVTPDDIYESHLVTQVDIADGNPIADTRFVIYALSPVDLYVENPQNQAIGVDPRTGSLVNSVYSGIYSGTNTEPEFLSVQGARDVWTVFVTGTEFGNYTLIIEDVEADNSQYVLTGNAEPGQVQIYGLDTRENSFEFYLNTAPDAFDDPGIQLNQGSSVTIPVTQNDVDEHPELLTVLTVGTPQHGQAVISADGRSIIYTPEVGYAGGDNILYTVQDVHGVASDQAMIQVNILPMQPTQSLAPIASDDIVTTDEDTSVVIDVLENDSDENNDTLTLVSVGQPQHGTVTIMDNMVTYQPSPNYHGGDHFNYVVTDGSFERSGMVQINITSVNDTPTLEPVSDLVSHAGDIVSLVITAHDADNGEIVRYEVSNLPDGLMIDPVTGVISGQILVTASGLYNVGIVVTDPHGATTASSFVWNVLQVQPTPQVQELTPTDQTNIPTSPTSTPVPEETDEPSVESESEATAEITTSPEEESTPNPQATP